MKFPPKAVLTVDRLAIELELAPGFWILTP